MLTTVNYLGHVISEGRIRSDKDKIAIIKEYWAPKTVYRQFFLNFSKIAQPLTHLTKKYVNFEWNDALCDKPILKYPDFSVPFYVTCDSSDTATGAALSQKTNGFEHPIYFISRQQKEIIPQRNENASVLFSRFKKWRYYLYGRKFTVVTDHRPLRWLLQMKELMSRLARWSLLLS
ncbi:hypothetical protein PR048_020007 [Dryococelus australis]|uniref:Reverse transcriptase RNase H-like domain-containing protein n=1 Tax=Dryococelus australis TaxID=614101 RepID=A0ABQ9H554_9NEOP|nr:hypothetical protein PR048_020007 [Dryococelus australis]